MVAQSTDFAARLYYSRERLDNWNDAVSYEGIYMDAWWNREACAQKDDLDASRIQSRRSQSLTIFAVDAPNMARQFSYAWSTLGMLSQKVALIFGAGATLRAPMIYSGLLGGGAFRNNRPLVLLLHLLLQPSSDALHVTFHHPVFWSFSDEPIDTLQDRILEYADIMLEAMHEEGIQTLGEALDKIMRFKLPLSENDADLTGGTGARLRRAKRQRT